MNARYVQRGESIDYIPSVAVAAGDVVIIGNLVGIAKMDIPANTLGALAIIGVFDIAKAAGEIAAGAALYWDAENKQATATAGANKYLGKSIAAAANADTTVRCKLSADAQVFAFDPGAAVADITDSTGGVAGANLAAPAGAEYTADELKANFALLASKFNALLLSVRTAGVIEE